MLIGIACRKPLCVAVTNESNKTSDKCRCVVAPHASAVVSLMRHLLADCSDSATISDQHTAAAREVGQEVRSDLQALHSQLIQTRHSEPEQLLSLRRPAMRAMDTVYQHQYSYLPADGFAQSSRHSTLRVALQLVTDPIGHANQCS